MTKVATKTVQAIAPTTPDVEIYALAQTIDPRSLSSVANFGRKIGDKTASYADELLSKARGGDLDEIGGKLNEIIVSAQSFDLASLDNRWARAPIVGPLIKTFVMTKQKAMARFASVQDQVDKLVKNVETTAARLSQRTAGFETMFVGVQQEHTALSQHVIAAKHRLASMDEEIATFGEVQDTAEAREELSVLRQVRAALDKRIADLSVLQHAALQTLPMIRVMQANNLALIDKFQTIQRLTLPAWKRTFLMALALDEQRDAGQLANSIDDATNYFMRRNAELLHENAVTTAKANQRLVVDIETLRHVHDEVVQTLLDVRTTHEQGAANRSSALAELEDLRERMSHGLLSVQSEEPRHGSRSISAAI